MSGLRLGLSKGPRLTGVGVDMCDRCRATLCLRACAEAGAGEKDGAFKQIALTPDVVKFNAGECAYACPPLSEEGIHAHENA